MNVARVGANFAWKRTIKWRDDKATLVIPNNAFLKLRELSAGFFVHSDGLGSVPRRVEGVDCERKFQANAAKMMGRTKGTVNL